MDAVEFLKEAKRYCRWCKNTAGDGNSRLCEVCYFEKLNDIFSLPPRAFRKFVETVEQWAKEHPVKTRQSEFLKMFPNAKLNDAKVIFAPPCEVDELLHDNEKCRSKDCSKCRRDYWLQEVEADAID